MKTTRYFGFLILLLSGLFFVQCTSDPIAGPPGMDGIDGADGVDGINGIDGQDGTASCVACHNYSHREPIEASYLISMHASGNATGYAGSRDSCSRCHSNEGYDNYITGKPAVDIDNPTNISCMTCHDKHSTFDFENDGHDYALRGLDPVSLLADASVIIDYGTTSNNCIECHQPRSTPPTDDGTGMYEITNKRFGPHHSPQVTMLEGIQGAPLAGSVDIPGPASATHRTGSSCVQCHMADAVGTDYTAGLHSWHTNENSCNSCHTNGAPDSIGNYDTDMETLRQSLEDLGMFDDSGYAKLQTVPILHAKAYWNWKMLVEDQSKGVHNPGYAKALLTNSIEALQQ